MFGFGSSDSVEKKVAKSVKLVRGTGPAVDLNKVESHGGIDLRKKSEAAGGALSRAGLQGIRAQVVCLLDYSGSMDYEYRSGNVQSLVERFLGFGLQVDADGEIPVVPFASYLLPTVNVSLDNYKGVVEREIMKNYMGSTNLTAALEELKKLANNTDAPIFCGVVTDGNPDNRSSATRLVCELANYPVFIKFLALNDVPYLQELDDLGDDKRLLDNVDAKSFGNLSSMSDESFAEAMADEWNSWITNATAKGILTT